MNPIAVVEDRRITPVVSVVIPVYNVSLYLTQCLESVIYQTYRNLEIIVIDDGSTDDSARICDEYAKQDPRIRVLHTGNRGLASARNLGLLSASGLYIAFLDGDDWYELQTIDTLVKTALQTEADIVVAYSSREYISKTFFPSAIHKSVQVYCGQDIMPAFTAGLFENVVWNKLYHADCFKSICFPEKHNYEDVATTWKLMKNLEETNGRISIVPEVLFHFRMRKSSITHSGTYNNILDSWVAFHGKYESLPDYQDMLLPECMRSIGKMWRNYWSFSKEDKEKAHSTLNEMRLFSQLNYHRVLRGKYSSITKAICFLSQSSVRPILFMCFYGGSVRSAYKNAIYKMYD